MTSAVFTLLHASQGLTYLLTFAPGIFLASAVYGHLALKSGSILAGLALHFAGDLAFAYFALLGGDSALLFVLATATPASAGFISYAIRGTPIIQVNNTYTPGATEIIRRWRRRGDKAALGSSDIDGYPR